MSDEVLRFGCYESLVVPGTSKTLLISCAGIGNPAADKMAFEFRGTIGKITNTDHVIYVKDLSRSWFNSSDGLDSLADFIKNYINTHSISRSVSIGLSSGGYGAMVLSHLVGLSEVYALSSRTVLGSNGDFDRRNRDLLGKYTHFQFSDLRDLVRPQGKYTFISSIDFPEDTIHVLRMQGFSNVDVFLTKGDHNLGEELKGAGLLEEFFANVLRKERLRISRFGLFKPLMGLDTLARAHLAQQKSPNVNISSEFRPSFDLLKTGHMHSLTRLVSPSKLPLVLGDGWGRAEENGVWAVGQEHTIQGHLVDWHMYHEVVLRLTVSPFLDSLVRRQRIELAMNGIQLPTRSIELGSEHEKQFEIWARVTSPSFVLSIRTPDAVSPSSLGKSSDPRELSIKLKRVRFAPSR